MINEGGMGNASLHLMCRGDDGTAIIAETGPDINLTSVYMVTRVNPGAIYYLVSIYRLRSSTTTIVS